VTVKNATELVILCENMLGWTPPDDKPLFKARSIEAGKLNKKIATNPKLYSLANLELALQMSFEEREPITSPVALCWRVERALKKAAPVEIKTDWEQETQRALEWEMAAPVTSEREYWVQRLTRVHGTDARKDLLNEWRGAGRG
jgi:hypothetical protein